MSIYDVAYNGTIILGHYGIGDEDEIIKTADGIMTIKHPHVIKDDFLHILALYHKRVGDIIGDENAFCCAAIADVFERHGISFDVGELFDLYDVSLDAFDNYSHVIRGFSHQWYWRNCEEYWCSSNRIDGTVQVDV